MKESFAKNLNSKIHGLFYKKKNDVWKGYK